VASRRLFGGKVSAFPRIRRRFAECGALFSHALFLLVSRRPVIPNETKHAPPFLDGAYVLKFSGHFQKRLTVIAKNAIGEDCNIKCRGNL
jgi:hypothetical protein